MPEQDDALSRGRDLLRVGKQQEGQVFALQPLQECLQSGELLLAEPAPKRVDDDQGGAAAAGPDQL